MHVVSLWLMVFLLALLIILRSMMLFFWSWSGLPLIFCGCLWHFKLTFLKERSFALIKGIAHFKFMVQYQLFLK